MIKTRGKITQKVKDNISAFVSITNGAGIKIPEIAMFSYKEKDDTIRLTYDYKNIEFLVDYHMDRDINLMIYDRAKDRIIKNNFVETKKELLSEMLKCIA